MIADTDDYFVSYGEWRDAMNNRCHIALTSDYCAGRIKAFEDLKDPSTAMFIDLFGEPYRSKVVSWFERAAGEG